MKKTILGIDQESAVRQCLDLVDVVLLDLIGKKYKSEKTEKLTIDGQDYVWVDYKSVVEWLPILGLSKRSLAVRLDRLVAKGLLKKHYHRNGENRTFFSPTEVVVEATTLCSSSGKGVADAATRGLHFEQQPCSYRDRDTVNEKKEKDNNKLLSKKKDDGDTFERAFERFMANSIDNGNFLYSLRGYKIKDYAALFDAFKLHVTNLCRQGQFIDNGDVRNRTWLLMSMPYLNLAGVTEYTLGYGEYLKDNRRWYRNRAGREIEVPMDAPPRMQGTIWYKEQGHWGPDI